MRSVLTSLNCACCTVSNCRCPCDCPNFHLHFVHIYIYIIHVRLTCVVSVVAYVDEGGDALVSLFFTCIYYIVI